MNFHSITWISTLSLHDALPILASGGRLPPSSSQRSASSWASNAALPPEMSAIRSAIRGGTEESWRLDRKSTRLNSSHSQISYAVFCLKKKMEFRQREDS